MKEIEGRNGGILKIQEKGDSSFNPAGRPKGSKNRSTILRQIVDQFAKMKPEERNKILQGYDLPEGATVEFMMALRMVDKVLKKGDVQAFNAIMDSLYGKSKTSEITIDDSTGVEKITIEYKKGDTINDPIE